MHAVFRSAPSFCPRGLLFQIAQAIWLLVTAIAFWIAVQPAKAQATGCSADASASACPATQAVVRREAPAYPMSRFRMGVDVHVGSGGIGSEAAVLLTRRFGLRAGSDFFSYSTVIESESNAIVVALRLRSAHAALDWYPTRHAFRVSPLLVFANGTHLRTSVNVAGGNIVTLNGADYESSVADPLHGSATVDLRAVSPGITIGFGRPIPKRGHHVSFPFEAGFYYAGTPAYRVDFTGTACALRFSSQPDCLRVQDDPVFKYNLAQFKARYQPDVNYATFYPIVSSGIAFAF